MQVRAAPVNKEGRKAIMMYVTYVFGNTSYETMYLVTRRM